MSLQPGDYAIQISKYPKVLIIDRKHELRFGYWVADHDGYKTEDIFFVVEDDLKKIEPKSLKERKALAAKIPWVRTLIGPAPCDATTVKRTPCTRDAEFHFNRHSDSYSSVKDANFCWTHLIYQGLMADMVEEARTHAWERKQFFASL